MRIWKVIKILLKNGMPQWYDENKYAKGGKK
jgi:hypothetical protein